MRLGIFARFACLPSPMHTQAKYLTKQPIFDRAESLVSIVRDLLGERDLEILTLVFEQRAIRRDQLAR
jgi:hypothetical protein